MGKTLHFHWSNSTQPLWLPHLHQLRVPEVRDTMFMKNCFCECLTWKMLIPRLRSLWKYIARQLKKKTERTNHNTNQKSKKIWCWCLTFSRSKFTVSIFFPPIQVQTDLYIIPDLLLNMRRLEAIKPDFSDSPVSLDLRMLGQKSVQGFSMVLVCGYCE